MVKKLGWFLLGLALLALGAYLAYLAWGSHGLLPVLGWSFLTLMCLWECIGCFARLRA